MEGHIPRSIIGQLEGEPQDIYGGAIVHFGPEEYVCGVWQPEMYLAFSCGCWKWALLVQSELAGWIWDPAGWIWDPLRVLGRNLISYC